jgi:transposase
MTASKAYIAIDAHAHFCVLGWRNGHGHYQSAVRFATSERELLKHIRTVPAGVKLLTVEESPLAAWIARTVQEDVQETLICDPRHNDSIRKAARKDDHRDTKELTRLLWMGQLHRVYHPDDDERAVFKAAVQQYLDFRTQQSRLKHQIKAQFRHWGVIDVDGTRIYNEEAREEWLDQIAHVTIRALLRRQYALLDVALRQERAAMAQVEVLGSRYPEIARFLDVPGVGRVGAHVFDAFIQTPDRFVTRAQLWRYCQLAVTDRSSDGKPLGFRRLDRNGNSELKAMSYWSWKGALWNKDDNVVKEFYRRSLERTHAKVHARLNTQRKIVATLWTMWKRKEAFDPTRFLSPTDA